MKRNEISLLVVMYFLWSFGVLLIADRAERRTSYNLDV